MSKKKKTVKMKNKILQTMMDKFVKTINTEIIYNDNYSNLIIRFIIKRNYKEKQNDLIEFLTYCNLMKKSTFYNTEYHLVLSGSIDQYKDMIRNCYNLNNIFMREILNILYETSDSNWTEFIDSNILDKSKFINEFEVNESIFTNQFIYIRDFYKDTCKNIFNKLNGLFTYRDIFDLIKLNITLSAYTDDVYDNKEIIQFINVYEKETLNTISYHTTITNLTRISLTANQLIRFVIINAKGESSNIFFDDLSKFIDYNLKPDNRDSLTWNKDGIFNYQVVEKDTTQYVNVDEALGDIIEEEYQINETEEGDLVYDEKHFL